MTTNRKKIAVVLSGAGFLDGSEITEAIAALMALDKENAQAIAFASDREVSAINHKTQTPETHPRNSLVESARIARGQVRSLSELQESEFEALVLPGGYGAALHLCTWAQKGAQCEVLPDLKKAIIDFHAASKPIGAICIAPVILARVLGSHQVCVTIGNDVETAQEIEKTGAIHEQCDVEEYVSDRLNKVLTTPAYMYDTTPYKVFVGVSKMIKELVEMA